MPFVDPVLNHSMHGLKAILMTGAHTEDVANKDESGFILKVVESKNRNHSVTTKAPGRSHQKGTVTVRNTARSTRTIAVYVPSAEQHSMAQLEVKTCILKLSIRTSRR